MMTMRRRMTTRLGDGGFNNEKRGYGVFLIYFKFISLQLIKISGMQIDGNDDEEDDNDNVGVPK